VTFLQDSVYQKNIIIWVNFLLKKNNKNKKHLKNVGPIRHCEQPHAACFTLPFTGCRYYRTPPLSHAACASMSTTTTTTTTTRDRGDRYGPMEWAQWHRYFKIRYTCSCHCKRLNRSVGMRLVQVDYLLLMDIHWVSAVGLPFNDIVLTECRRHHRQQLLIHNYREFHLNRLANRHGSSMPRYPLSSIPFNCW